MERQMLECFSSEQITTESTDEDISTEQPESQMLEQDTRSVPCS